MVPISLFRPDDFEPPVLGASGGTSPNERASNLAYEAGARIDRMMLACEAMWSFLSEKLSLTDDELVQRMNDLDLSDGKLDGKVRKGAVSCPKCGRTISRRLPKCIYCGQPIVHDPFV